MVNNADAEAPDRPIKTYDDLCNSSDAWTVGYWKKCLMEPDEFLKVFHERYKHKVSRRTLQLYSSPQLKLLPLPIHRGGHKSYYLNPEHTERLAVVMHLREKLFFPLKEIRQVMDTFPPEHYEFILNGTLTGEEIQTFSNALKRGFGLKDILYRKACAALEAISDPVTKGIEKYGDDPMIHAERYANRVLIQEAQDLQKWLRTDRRFDMGYLDQGDEDWALRKQEDKARDQELKEWARKERARKQRLRERKK